MVCKGIREYLKNPKKFQGESPTTEAPKSGSVENRPFIAAFVITTAFFLFEKNCVYC